MGLILQEELDRSGVPTLVVDGHTAWRREVFQWLDERLVQRRRAIDATFLAGDPAETDPIMFLSFSAANSRSRLFLAELRHRVQVYLQAWGRRRQHPSISHDNCPFHSPWPDRYEAQELHQSLQTLADAYIIPVYTKELPVKDVV